MALPDTLASVERIPARRQLAALRSGKYSCAMAQRGLWRRKRLFFHRPPSAILAQLPDFARNVRQRHPISLKHCSVSLAVSWPPGMTS